MSIHRLVRGVRLKIRTEGNLKYPRWFIDVGSLPYSRGKIYLEKRSKDNRPEGRGQTEHGTVTPALWMRYPSSEAMGLRLGRSMKLSLSTLYPWRISFSRTIDGG